MVYAPIILQAEKLNVFIWRMDLLCGAYAKAKSNMIVLQKAWIRVEFDSICLG